MVPVMLMAFAVTTAVVQARLIRTIPKDPYASLFRVPPFIAGQPSAARLEPRVVCGMTLIPADPTVDPRIRIVVPSTPEHKINAVRPPVCVD